MPRDENMIAALKRERAGYVARGDDDRIAQVDEQLARLGYEPAQAAVAEADGGPKGRTADAGQRTADDGADKGPAPAKKTAAKKTAASKPDAPAGS